MAFLKRMFRKFFRSKASEDDIRRLPTDNHVREINEPTITEAKTNYWLWIPWAENVHRTKNLKMRTRGEYDEGYAEGSVIHWAGAWVLAPHHFWNPFPLLNAILHGKYEAMARQKAMQVIKHGVKNGYNYLAMDMFGNILQSRPLNKHGYHAGKSYAEGLGYNVSRKLIGIEVIGPGKVKSTGEVRDGKRIFKTWYGQEFTEDYVRHVEKKDNMEKGYYVMFTKEQENALLDLHSDLLLNSPIDDNGKRVFKLKNIHGHDSVSPGRKSDPGGSLSVTIPEFRKLVSDRVKEILANPV